MSFYIRNEMAILCIAGTAVLLVGAWLAGYGKQPMVPPGPRCVEWETRPIITIDPQTHKTIDVWVPVCTRFKASGGIRKTT
jgi:hypothetical protein